MAGEQETRSYYPDTPEGQYQLWVKEFEAADEWLRDTMKDGETAVKAFLDERGDGEQDETHLAFFWANVKTLMALLYGRVPKVTVSRRHGDPNDDLARVGALILERMLNNDVERYEDGYRDALTSVLCDFLLPGFGTARVRYTAKFEDQQFPERGAPGEPKYAAAAQKRVKVPGTEDVASDYVFWGDQKWSPCRTHADKRWHAYRLPMTREDLHARFDKVLGDDAVERIPLNGKLFAPADKQGEANDKDDPWARAEVWEIWDKQRRQVVWFVSGYNKVLQTQPDPLGLAGFWPSPRPLMANTTTTAHRPRSDYRMVQDTYRDINLLATRISELEDALRVAGVYDENVKGIERLLDENARNQLIPVKGFANISEKGGMERVIAWLPMDAVAATLDKTREQLGEKQRVLYELTGWSDIMRGQLNDPQQLATNTRAATRYGSIRQQSIQDEFARYASDFQRLRAEIIIKFFDDQTILQRSNILQTPDKDLALPALKMLRQDFAKYAVEVKPENVALADFASMKAERTEFMDSFTRMLETTGRLSAALGPVALQVAPAIIEVVKWAAAGYRSSAGIEGVLDKLAAQLQTSAQQMAANPQAPQPDPKVMAEQAKLQADVVREQMKVQGEQQRQQVKTQGEAARQQVQLQANVEEARQQMVVKRQEGAMRVAERTAVQPTVRRRGAKP